MILAKRLLSGSRISSGRDPHIDLVDFLYNPVGAVGDTTYPDAVENYTISALGSPAPAISMDLGKKSLLFNGSSGLVTSYIFAYLHDGVTQWTFDYAFRDPVLGSVETIWVNTKNTTATIYKFLQIVHVGADIAIILGKHSAFYIQTSSGIFSADTEHKVRITFNGSVLSVYVDGVQKGSVSKPVGFYPGTDAQSINAHIGRFQAGQYPLSAHLLGLRITKGLARDGSEIFKTPFPTA